MSLQEKMRHQRKRGMSRARSLLHRHDGHKMASLVNQVHFARHHGLITPKHKGEKAAS